MHLANKTGENSKENLRGGPALDSLLFMKDDSDLT